MNNIILFSCDDSAKETMVTLLTSIMKCCENDIPCRISVAGLTTLELSGQIGKLVVDKLDEQGQPVGEEKEIDSAEGLDIEPIPPTELEREAMEDIESEELSDEQIEDLKKSHQIPEPEPDPEPIKNVTPTKRKAVKEDLNIDYPDNDDAVKSIAKQGVPTIPEKKKEPEVSNPVAVMLEAFKDIVGEKPEVAQTDPNNPWASRRRRRG